jgi:hypothetical protein
MATEDDVIDLIELLMNSGLDYTPSNPKKQEIMVEVWAQAFNDIPGDILRQAAGDYLKTESKWPSPAKLRQVAEKVKARNGQSIAGGQFKQINQPRTPFKGAFRVAGWTNPDAKAAFRAGVFVPVYRSENPQPVIGADDPEMEPPEHPDFANWVEAQAWQEEQGEPV